MVIGSGGYAFNRFSCWCEAVQVRAKVRERATWIFGFEGVLGVLVEKKRDKDRPQLLR